LKPRPIIGGILSEPAARWPALFGKSKFFQEHPYFLPCAAAGLLAFISGAIAIPSLKEVSGRKLSYVGLLTKLQSSPTAIAREKDRQRRALEARNGTVTSTTPLLNRHQVYGSRENAEGRDIVEETPATFRSLLIHQVIFPLAVYMVQALVDMSSTVLLPLMYSTSIPLGGLGFDAYHIGVILSVWGVIYAVVMVLVLGRAIRKFGPRTVHIFCYATYFVNIALYPLLAHFVQGSRRVDAKIWAVIVVQLICRLANGMSYGTPFL